MSLLALDLSLASTGMVFEGAGFKHAATLPKDRKLKGDARLVGLRNGLEAQLDVASDLGDPVVAAALEDLPNHAMSAGRTGRAQGVARMVLSERGIPFVEISPATLKKAAVGKGNAKKEDMKAGVPERIDFTLGNGDEIDAFWLLQSLRHMLGLPAHLADPVALGKVDQSPLKGVRA